MDSQRKTISLDFMQEVSAFLMQHFRQVGKGVDKGDGSLVSAADQGAEAIILEALKRHFPDDGILSEESPEAKSTNGYRWIIDPLDGTHNFLAGYPTFGSLLALEEQGQVVWGVCSFPALGELFVAEKGQGATCNGAPIQVTASAELKGGMFLSDGNYRKARERIFADLAACANAGCRLRIFGTSPWSMTRVALGQAIIATNRACYPWDVAAPALIVEEAGGKVTDPLGKPWNFEAKDLIATNGVVHEQVLKLLA